MVMKLLVLCMREAHEGHGLMTRTRRGNRDAICQDQTLHAGQVRGFELGRHRREATITRLVAPARAGAYSALQVLQRMA